MPIGVEPQQSTNHDLTFYKAVIDEPAKVKNQLVECLDSTPMTLHGPGPTAYAAPPELSPFRQKVDG
jgi:hypothetical protein